jgi:uncharacterized spore protein YtfJ
MGTPQPLDGAPYDGAPCQEAQYQQGAQNQGAQNQGARYQEARYLAEREAGDSAGDYLQGLAELIRGRASVSAVFGEPVEGPAGTIIPVARVRFVVGGGLGRGDDLGEGGGGGGGAMADPIGYIQIKDGTATYRPIHRPVSHPLGELLRPAAVVLALAVARRVRTRLRRRVR